MNAKQKELLAKMPYKWKVQGTRGQKKNHYEEYNTFVAYVDARAVQNRFDDVFGLNWQRRHRIEGGQYICEIGVLEGNQWIWREDVGTPSAMDAEKGGFSDAFKRAAINFGPGRFLYDIPMVKSVTMPKPWELDAFCEEAIKGKENQKVVVVKTPQDPPKKQAPDLPELKQSQVAALGEKMTAAQVLDLLAKHTTDTSNAGDVWQWIKYHTGSPEFTNTVYKLYHAQNK